MRDDTARSPSAKEPTQGALWAEPGSYFIARDRPLLTWPAIEPAKLYVAVVDCRRRAWSIWLEEFVGRDLALEAICKRRRFIVVTDGPSGRSLDAVDSEAELVRVCARADMAARGLGGGLQLHACLDSRLSRAILGVINVQRLRDAPPAGSA